MVNLRPIVNYQRVVVKLGTSTLTAGTERLSPPRLVELIRQIAQLHTSGQEMVLVSSGAIAVGRAELNFPALPKDIPAKQMLAAVGQPRLMALYEQLFQLYSLTVAQVLLTRADLSDRKRYLNSRNTITALLSQGVIPIVNENDTVATEEIRLGDNDNLSALVANLVEADLLIMLTDQPGLFTADPRRDPEAQLIHQINSADIPRELWEAAGGANNRLGTGGMFTKLQAAELARRSGAEVIIAQGSATDVITRLVAGEALGTRFSVSSTATESRKRYLLASGIPSGRVHIDRGAADALKKGGSLLPVGIQSIAGSFERGDTIQVLESSGREVARGLTNYSAYDLSQITGKHSNQIEATLGYAYGDEVIHRNNMVLL